MGADVIKFEVAERPATRALHSAGGQEWTRPYNRSGYFNLFTATSAISCSTLRRPKGQGALPAHGRSLRTWCWRITAPGSSPTWGSTTRRWPLATLASSCARCPASARRARRLTTSRTARISRRRAASSPRPATGRGELYGTGSYYADPIAGAHGTIGILAALIARERTGRGQYIDMALQSRAPPSRWRRSWTTASTGASPVPRTTARGVSPPRAPTAPRATTAGSRSASRATTSGARCAT